jgi:hypothetical protein
MKHGSSLCQIISIRHLTPYFFISKDDNNDLLITDFVLDKIHRLAPSYYQMALWDYYRDLAATLHQGVDPQTYQQISRVWLAGNLAPEHMTGLIEAQNAVQKHCQSSASPLALRRSMSLPDPAREGNSICIFSWRKGAACAAGVWGGPLFAAGGFECA